jgi:hypothetical protein
MTPDGRVDRGLLEVPGLEIFGHGVSPLLPLSNLATGAGLLVILALHARTFHNPQPTPVAIGLVVLATVAIMTVSNKTLSPQHLLWLGGPMAALLILRSTATERGEVNSAPAHDPTPTARCLDPAGLPAAVRRPAGPRG